MIQILLEYYFETDTDTLHLGNQFLSIILNYQNYGRQYNILRKIFEIKYIGILYLEFH